MRLKKKPKKPVRQIKEFTDNIYEATVQYLMDEYGPEAVVKHDWWGYGDERTIVTWEREETDEEFQKRMDSYKRRLATYEEWYEENKEVIEAELADRKAKKQAKEKAAKARKLAALEKEVAKLKKGL